MNTPLNTNRSGSSPKRQLLKHAAIFSCLLGFSMSSGAFGENTGNPLPTQSNTVSLGDIENLKTDIVKLNATFKELENEYLYPPSVDTALFVSVDTGQFFTVNNVEARIDGKPVAGHFYTATEQEALRKGGIQRLEELQLKPGNYQLVVTVIGKDTQGETIKRGITHDFEKTNQPVGLELQLIDSTDSKGLELSIKTWKL